MKNWKCVVGATLLTPICVVLIAGLLVGILWIVQNCSIAGLLFMIASVLFLVYMLWTGLFEHCIEFWQKRKEE